MIELGSEPARRSVLRLLPASLIALVGCTPTVRVAAPEKPITINLNIKLDADVRLRVEQQAEQDVEKKPIF